VDNPVALINIGSGYFGRIAKIVREHNIQSAHGGGYFIPLDRGKGSLSLSPAHGP